MMGVAFRTNGAYNMGPGVYNVWIGHPLAGARLAYLDSVPSRVVATTHKTNNIRRFR